MTMRSKAESTDVLASGRDASVQARWGLGSPCRKPPVAAGRGHAEQSRRVLPGPAEEADDGRARPSCRACQIATIVVQKPSTERARKLFMTCTTADPLIAAGDVGVVRHCCSSGMW